MARRTADTVHLRHTQVQIRHIGTRLAHQPQPQCNFTLRNKMIELPRHFAGNALYSGCRLGQKPAINYNLRY